MKNRWFRSFKSWSFNHFYSFISNWFDFSFASLIRWYRNWSCWYQSSSLELTMSLSSSSSQRDCYARVFSVFSSSLVSRMTDAVSSHRSSSAFFESSLISLDSRIIILNSCKKLVKYSSRAFFLTLFWSRHLYQIRASFHKVQLSVHFESLVYI
jgi:hypothetical protein